MIELPKDKSIAQRCAVLNLDFDESFIGEDVKNTLEAANQFAQYSKNLTLNLGNSGTCLLYTSPSPRDPKISRMPSSA